MLTENSLFNMLGYVIAYPKPKLDQSVHKLLAIVVDADATMMDTDYC
jgi:hypothetical protein